MVYNKGLKAYHKDLARQNDLRVWDTIGKSWLSIEKEAKTAVERLKLYREAGALPIDLQNRSNSWKFALGERLIKESGFSRHKGGRAAGRGARLNRRSK